jgi:hypothetical protein
MDCAIIAIARTDELSHDADRTGPREIASGKLSGRRVAKGAM